MAQCDFQIRRCEEYCPVSPLSKTFSPAESFATSLFYFMLLKYIIIP